MVMGFTAYFGFIPLDAFVEMALRLAHRLEA